MRYCAVCLNIALLLSVYPTQLPATEPLGHLSLQFGGESSEWVTQLREVRGKLRHSARLRKRNLVDEIEITAYPADSAVRERFAISIVFSRALDPDETPDYSRPTDITIVRLLGSVADPRWEARDIDMDYSFQEASDTEGALTGQFTATLCHSEGPYDDPDEASCLPASGKIETIVHIDADD
ncbi:hypothetical protein ACW9UR_23365 [Halovulum sp. GXIMD14794]